MVNVTSNLDEYPALPYAFNNFPITYILCMEEIYNIIPFDLKNEVFSILVPEPVKVDKPVIKKVQETKVTVVAPIKKKVVPQKKKDLNEEEIKVIHSKSKVTFKSTEF